MDKVGLTLDEYLALVAKAKDDPTFKIPDFYPVVIDDEGNRVEVVGVSVDIDGQEQMIRGLAPNDRAAVLRILKSKGSA